MTPTRTDGTGSQNQPRGSITTQPVWLLFLTCSIVLLPLQKAFTVSVGFPLKPTEILLILAAATGGLRASHPRWQRSSIACLALFAASFILTDSFELADIPNRWATALPPGFNRSLRADMLLYVFYGFLVIIAWLMISSRPADAMQRAYCLSARVAALATLLEIGLYETNDIARLRQLGYVLVLGSGFGVPLPRNGPFFEGNYLGFYAVTILFITIHARDRLGIACALFCLVVSQSTNAIAAAVVAVLVAAVWSANSVWQRRILTLSVVSTLAILSFSEVRTYAQFQLSKLGLAPSIKPVGASHTSMSIDLRTAKNQIGLRMFAEHPLGVGSGRFGAWFGEYADGAKLPPGYLSSGARPIVENAYLQIAVELGFITLLLFIIFLLLTLFHARTTGPAMLAMTLAVAIMLAASPSWTTLTIWYVLAFVSAQRPPAGIAEESDTSDSSRTTQPPQEQVVNDSALRFPA